MALFRIWMQDSRDSRSRGRKIDAVQLHVGHEEFVGDVNHDAATVARLRVATTGATVGQVHEDLQAVLYNFMGTVAIDVAHESDTAGIVFVVRLVETFPGY